MYHNQCTFPLIGLTILASSLFGSSLSSAHDLAWPGEKLKVLSPQAASFEQKNLYVSDEIKALLEKALGGRLPEEDLKPSIYLAVVKSSPEASQKKAAAIIFIDTHGEGGKIEMGVVVNGKGEIMRVHLFENKEPESINLRPFSNSLRARRNPIPLKSVQI